MYYFQVLYYRSMYNYFNETAFKNCTLVHFRYFQINIGHGLSGIVVKLTACSPQVPCSDSAQVLFFAEFKSMMQPVPCNVPLVLSKLKDPLGHNPSQSVPRPTMFGRFHYQFAIKYLRLTPRQVWKTWPGYPTEDSTSFSSK